jgi:hypothetical protein
MEMSAPALPPVWKQRRGELTVCDICHLPTLADTCFDCRRDLEQLTRQIREDLERGGVIQCRKDSDEQIS